VHLANIISLVGLFTLTAIAWALSSQGPFAKSSSTPAPLKRPPLKLVATGLGLQMLFAVLVLGIPALHINGPLRFLFTAANEAFGAILKFTDKGASFVFGELAQSSKLGLIIAFQVLPIIIFMSAMMAILYHLGIMQKIVSAFAFIMQKLLGISGAESLSASANIFFGQTEAPLVVRPFIGRMTQSELFCVMVGGMATVAGSVLGAYTALLKDRIPDIAGHLLTASVLSAPAAIVVAKLMMPETEKPETLGGVPEEYKKQKTDTNVIEATARGAHEGLYLALNVAAMLIAFIAVVAMADAGFKLIGQWIGFQNWGQQLVPEILKTNGHPIELSFSLVFGWFFAPLAWLMGIPWAECAVAGTLLGQKMVLNEFIAYLRLADIASQLSERTVIILSYALCGFANFSSIGIIIGGIGSIAPHRKADLARLGFKAMIGGSLAAFMTAAVAGFLI